MKQKVVCIVQARRRSKRLPDKILRPLGGEPALAHVLTRCKSIPLVDEVICAGVDDAHEDPIFAIAQGLDVSCFRGSETDVLSRYYFAAKEAQADWVMRVTSDCPLFDPAVANTLVEETLKSGKPFGANARWPHGLDCELFSFNLLEAAHTNATSTGEREHVTLWMKRLTDLEMFHLFPPTDDDLGKKYRWVLDYPEDYDFLQKIYEELEGYSSKTAWHTIIKILEKVPSLQTINERQADTWAVENANIHKEP